MENHARAVMGPKSEFHKMPTKIKKEYYSRIVSDVHAIVAIVASVYTIYFACDDVYKHGDTAFTNFECLNTPRLSGLYIIPVSSAYCVYDIYICIVEIKFTAKECSDYLFHHIVGVLGAIVVLVCGQFPVALSVGNLVSECSNFCMNIRWRLLKHKMTETNWFFAASVVFMIVFFFSRVVFMLMLNLRALEVNKEFPWSS